MRYDMFCNKTVVIIFFMVNSRNQLKLVNVIDSSISNRKLRDNKPISVIQLMLLVASNVITSHQYVHERCGKCGISHNVRG